MVRRLLSARRSVGWLLVGLPLGFFAYDVLWFLGHYVSGYFTPTGVSRTLLVLSLEAAVSAVPVGIGVVLLVRPGHPPRTIHTEHPVRRVGGWALVLVPSVYTILMTGTEGLVLGALIVSGVLLLRASRPHVEPAATHEAAEGAVAQDEAPVAH